MSAMKTIGLLPGQRIETVARVLCCAAPARADFNGIPLRARYATTKPRDIVASYWRKVCERSWAAQARSQRKGPPPSLGESRGAIMGTISLPEGAS